MVPSLNLVLCAVLDRANDKSEPVSRQSGAVLGCLLASLGGLVAALALAALLVVLDASGNWVRLLPLRSVRLVAARLNLLVDATPGAVGSAIGEIGAIDTSTSSLPLCINAALSIGGAVGIGAAPAPTVIGCPTVNGAAHLPSGIVDCDLSPGRHLGGHILAASLVQLGIVAHASIAVGRAVGILGTEQTRTAFEILSAIDLGSVGTATAFVQRILWAAPWAANLVAVVIRPSKDKGGVRDDGLLGVIRVVLAALLLAAVVASAISVRARPKLGVGCAASSKLPRAISVGVAAALAQGIR